MRSLKLLLLPILLLVLYVPAQAQGGLLGAINSDDQFTILAEAVAAADPSVAELLSGGSYTLLAPNNTAFENLASFLDVDLDVLLAQEAIVTDLLLYHTLDGALFSPQLINQYDGTVIPTLLENAFVNVDVLDDGTIQLNDVAEIISPDRAVGSSVIHVLNDVLLNRVITRQLDSLLNGEEAATEETPSTEASAAADDARVRVLHAASNLAPLSLTLGETVIADGVAYGEASEFVTVAPGALSASFGAGTQEIDVEGVLTLLYIEVDGEAQLLPIDQSEIPGEDEAALVLVNALQGADEVSLEFDGEGQPFAEGEVSAITTSVGSHTVGAVVNSIAVSEVSFVLPAGSRFLVALIGTPDAPQLVRLDTPVSLNGEADSETENARQTLAALLTADDRFSLLREAIELVDADLLEALDSGDSFTVFAPTDAAVEALLATAGVNSLDDLDSLLLRDIVRYHIIPGELRSDSLADLNGQSVFTRLTDNQVTIGVLDDGSIQVNGIATVTEADVVASNGVVHIIDEVLLPQSALEALGL